MQNISARRPLARGAVAPPAGKLLLALRRLRRSLRGCAGAPRRRSPAIYCSPGRRRRRRRRQLGPARPRNCPTLAGAGLRFPAAAPALSACAPCLAQVRGVCLEPAGRTRPSGPAHDPGVWTRRRHCRAPKLVTVYQAGTCEAHTLGRMRRDRSGARCHCRVSRSIAAYKSRLSRRARTARERRLRPDRGSALS